MTELSKITGYVIVDNDGNCIWGDARTEEGAWADAEYCWGDDNVREHCTSYAATEALIASGTPNSWGYVDHPEHGRVACTSEESLEHDSR